MKTLLVINFHFKFSCQISLKQINRKSKLFFNIGKLIMYNRKKKDYEVLKIRKKKKRKITWAEVRWKKNVLLYLKMISSVSHVLNCIIVFY